MGKMLVRGLLATLGLVLGLASAAGSSTGHGLYGAVEKGPIRPVCAVGQPCDGPAQVTLLFSRTTQSGALVRYAARSKATGSYRIALPAGYYDVTTKERVGVGRKIKPQRVHVRSGRWDKIDFFIDTGIR
ncbi:MAG: hypothetical protein C5B48_02115 [Candidatus Rokuibacteriota bacterium]|nr:MAG: hypothetical protein C5B48_02115 [Candidatus Rokubacteria bacterium]